MEGSADTSGRSREDADADQPGPERSAALVRVASLALIAWLLLCLALRFA